jgi:putative endonuclease
LTTCGLWVYVIRSTSCGQVYVGQTQNLDKRLREHNDSQCFSSRFTKRYPGPWMLIHQETYETRSEAMRRERWLKSRSGRRFLRSVGC